jgi:hypothetical protein
MYGHSAPQMRGVRLRERSGVAAVGSPARTASAHFGLWSRVKDRLRLLRLTPMVYLHDLLALGAPLKLTRMLERRGLLDPRRAEARVRRLRTAIGDERLLDMHLRMWINSYKRNTEEGHMVHVYDFLTRVPLILHAPGRLPAGVQIPRMVRQVDILPTLCDLAGLPAETWGAVEGQSLTPLLDRGVESKNWSARPAFQSVSGTPADIELRGVRTETHRFTYGPFNDELPCELYDLRADPGETVNIAGADPGLCDDLKAVADRFAIDAAAPAEMNVPQDEQAEVERRLRGLGYL